MRGTWATGTSGNGGAGAPNGPADDASGGRPSGRAGSALDPFRDATPDRTPVRVPSPERTPSHAAGGGVPGWNDRAGQTADPEGTTHDRAGTPARRRPRAPRTARLGGLDVADGRRRRRDLPAPPTARAVQGARRARPRGAARRRPDQAARGPRRPPPRARPRARGGPDDPRRAARHRRPHRPGRPAGRNRVPGPAAAVGAGD